MDIRERIEDQREAIEAAMDARQSQMWTSSPAKIVEYDAKTKTAKVQLTIKGTIRKKDGSVERVEIPEIQDVPVYFPSGMKGKATLTFPIVKDDECLVVFASRSIDQWHQSGKVEQQVSARMHDLSDAMCYVGFSSKPNVQKDISTKAVQLRLDNDEGKPKHFVEWHPDDGITTSVDEGKHVTKVHPKDGVTISVDKDKHVMTVHPENGIKHKSSVKVEIEASKVKVSGPLKVSGQIQSGVGLKAPLYEAIQGPVPEAPE